MKKEITEFSGEYSFLSNFYPCTLTYEGITYNSSEAAFQAQKASPEDRYRFSLMNPGQSKKEARKLQINVNHWSLVKDQIMLDVVREKFKNPYLSQLLLDTGDSVLIEGNTWNDQYWGVCNGKGLNKLGMVLMTVRDELKAKQRMP